jgi:predicted small lipoprotein YifL
MPRPSRLAASVAWSVAVLPACGTKGSAALPPAAHASDGSVSAGLTLKQRTSRTVRRLLRPLPAVYLVTVFLPACLTGISGRSGESNEPANLSLVIRPTLEVLDSESSGTVRPYSTTSLSRC